MKRKFVCLFIFFLFGSIYIQAQSSQSTDWELNHLKAQVQSVQETNISKTKENLIDEEFEITHFTEFNQDGYISRWTRFRNGEKEESGRFEYDAKNNRILRVKYDADDEELYQNLIDFVYDKDLILEKLSRNPDSEGYSKTIYHYDQAANLIEEKFFIDEELIEWKKYTYNEKNQKIEFFQLNRQGEPLLKSEYTYDSNGNLIQDKGISQNGHINFSINYEYNADGQLVKEYSNSPHHQNTKVYNPKGDLILETNKKEGDNYTYEYQYQYDEKGNWILRSKSINGKLKFDTKREIVYY